MQVRIVDSQPGAAPVAHDWEFDTARLPLREFIRQRVTREVTAFNQDRPEVFHGLVQPEESERVLNGYRVKTLAPVDPERQFARAVESFHKNGFLVIAAGRQVESLDEEIDLASGSIEFIRLVPHVGG